MHNTLHAFIMVIYAECGLGIVTAEELLISDKFQKLKFQSCSRVCCLPTANLPRPLWDYCFCKIKGAARLGS